MEVVSEWLEHTFCLFDKLIYFSLFFSDLMEFCLLVWQKREAEGETWFYAEAEAKDQTKSSDTIGRKLGFSVLNYR